MEYRFTPERENYEPYASGSVLYAAPGRVVFPVRLANEIFRRCMAFRAQQAPAPCVIYDPCCGSAYHLTTIAYFNWDRIASIHGSDIDAEVLPVAARNLGLLRVEGLEQRIQQLSELVQRFGKESHQRALMHALSLRERLGKLLADHVIETRLFRADATDAGAVGREWDGKKADIVITDVPYGQRTDWRLDGSPSTETVDPLHALLDSLLPILVSNAVVAVASAKQDKIKHRQYRRLEKFNVGRRQIVILQPISSA